ncbi:hypothetical protein KBY97_00465 [Synechococcus sp. ATX 2A4]|nr:hypothetical protein [Synechococcus sp. ATX 2A4]
MPETNLPFSYLISLKPLGLLYASSGRFLSAENLTGKAGEHFPPDSPAFAGLLAAHLPKGDVWHLHTAGPFWHQLTDHLLGGGQASLDIDLMVPAPLTLLQRRRSHADQQREVVERLIWHEESERTGWITASGNDPPDKPLRGGWIPISLWDRITRFDSVSESGPLTIWDDPWKAVPHLHPRLRNDERVSAQQDALFLEYAVALDPAVALAYLSSHKIDDGVYRFGGEGHLVEISTHSVPKPLQVLLGHDHLECFSLITPGVWGTSRLSKREPEDQRPAQQRFGEPAFPFHSKNQGPGILTERPRSWRHHLGHGTPSTVHPEKRAGVRRLSRGRWAMVAGSCYHLPSGHSLKPWAQWSEDWFPREGFSFKRLGTGLALPLHPEGP